MLINKQIVLARLVIRGIIQSNKPRRGKVP